MKDCIRQDVVVYDTIMLVLPYSHDMGIGIIEKITPKGIIASYVTQTKITKKVFRTPSQFVRI